MPLTCGMSISVEVKQAGRRQLWYVTVDFGDGSVVTKGPMTHGDALAMADDFRKEAEGSDGVLVDTLSEREARTNAIVFYAMIGILLALIAGGIAFFVLVTL